MKSISLLMIINAFFFISCTQPEYKTILTGDSEKFVEEHGSLTDNETTFTDGFYVETDATENLDNVKQASTSIERIPNFQANEFKSITTENRKNIKKDIVLSGGNVKINVESIPLNEFVDFIFSSVLKVNYTVDKSVKKMKQPITLNMAKVLPKKQVLMVVKNILENESVGFTQKEDTLFISKTSKRKALEGLSDRYMVFGRELSPNIKESQKVLMFVPFYYTKPEKLRTFSKRLGINKVKINFLNENMAVLSGEAFDVRQLLELVNVVDAPSMEQRTPYLLKLEYIEVKKFAERMQSILESNSIPIANSIREVGVVLTPIEEINTLLILSSKESWIEMLTFWKNKLDLPSEVDTEHSQLYIYKVKNRKADEFAEVLQDVLSIRSSQENTDTIDNNSSVLNASNEVGVNIKSDLHTNSLMLNITPAQYKKVFPLIKRLDVLPLQVAIEVTLAEVTMTDTFSLGFEWALFNNKAITGVPTQVSGAHTLLFGGAGITSSLFTKNLTSAINAFAEKKQLEILSRPRLVILNNKTGNINVGQQVPVVSSEATVDDLSPSSILRNITYISTGMTVNLTPTINSNGTLTLDINVVLSEAQTNKTSSIDSPLIVNRSLTTSAVMQSGNSILLGGIISHNKSNGHGGVPFLQDLPFIGDAFKSQSKSHVKTELIILIKPKILKSNRELSSETEKFKLLLKNLHKTMVF